MAAASVEAPKVEPREANGPQPNPTPNQNNTGHGGRGGRGGRGGGNQINRQGRFQNSPGGRRDEIRGREGQQWNLPDVKPEVGQMEEVNSGSGQQNYQRGNQGGRGRGFRGGGAGGRDGPRANNEDHRINEKLLNISGPSVDLPPFDTKEKKFAGHCRLYIGNLTNDVSEEEINGLFSTYGETAEVFINKEKNFAFIRMDYRANAEKAKRELNGYVRKGRQLKVRFAPLGAAVKVKNLTPWVSNELLELAFSVFGEVEKAVIIVDERGNSQREGIVEFARKPSAMAALRKCSEGCFFITSSLKPIILEPFEQMDDIDGYPERNLPKKSSEYYKAREVGPRFAAVGSFEFEYGTRWKQLYDLYKQKEDALKREMKMDEDKLEAQMEYARYEHETEILREQLRQREIDRERQKREWEIKERQAEEQRRADEDMMRRQQEDMQMRMLHQEDEMRRRQQENSLFMQDQGMRQSLPQYETGGVPDPAVVRDYDSVIAGGAGPLPGMKAKNKFRILREAG
uniref:RRM domain-containing protein n=1 Tax=Clastoptera arizonana TaxID=38151 RepID=A0A1B6DWX5_9HEMI